MRILTISNYFPNHSGGIEIVAQNLVSRWRKRHQVHWAASATSANPYTYEIEDIPLTSSNFTEDRLGFPYPIPTLQSAKTIINQIRWCDIVHIHDCLYFSNIIAFFFSVFFSKPLIVTQHIGTVTYTEKYKNILQQLAYHTIGKLILVQSNEVVFINENIKSWFEARMELPKTSLIQNGVDHHIFFPPARGEKKTTRAQLGFSKDGVILLFTGRFTPKKGLDLIYRIAKARPKYQWILVGDGKVDVTKWNLPNVKVLPRQTQNELRKFYIAADMLILPSQGEGFPLVVQEALSCGLPAAVSEEIATSLPDAPLISLDISSITNLVSTIDKTIAAPKSLTLTSYKSIEYAKSWDWDDIALQYEELFINSIKVVSCKNPKALKDR